MIKHKGSNLIPAPKPLLLAVLKSTFVLVVATAICVYLTCITTVRILDSGACSFQSNGYNWIFRVTSENILRWLLGAVAMFIFLMAVARKGLPLPSPTSAWKTVALFCATWLALKTQYNWYLSWTFAFVCAITCAGIYCAVQHRALARSACQRIITRARAFVLWYPSALAGTAFLILGLSIYAIHGGYPVLVDEQSQLAQVHLLLSGKLNFEASPEFLKYAVLPSFLASSPTASQFPPGGLFPMLPIVGIGLPGHWLNAICGALTVFFTMLFAGRMLKGHVSVTACVAGLLLLASPQFIVIQSSAMNHGITMLMLVIAAWAFQECVIYNRWRLLPIGIFTLAWAGITRPYTAVPHGLVWGVVLAGSAARVARMQLRSSPAHYASTALSRRLRWIPLAPRIRGLLTVQQLSPVSRQRTVTQFLFCTIAAAVPLALLAWYNYQITGHPLLFGYQKAQIHPVEFGFSDTVDGRYTPIHALHNGVCDVLNLSHSMFGWLIPSWVLMFGWLVHTSFSRSELMVLALIILQFLFYRMYFWYELIMGSRYLSELMPFCACLAAIGLTAVIRKAAPAWRPTLLGIVAIFSASAAIGSITHWSLRMRTYTSKHATAKEYMQKHLSNGDPIVVIIPYEYNDVAASYAFTGTPVWFVYQDDEQAARQTPEFKQSRWVHLFGPPPTHPTPPLLD